MGTPGALRSSFRQVEGGQKSAISARKSSGACAGQGQTIAVDALHGTVRSKPQPIEETLPVVLARSPRIRRRGAWRRYADGLVSDGG